MKRIILLSIFLCSVLSISARVGRSSSNNSKDYLVFGLGANYMFGDAGGANFENLWATDWDVLYSRPSISLGYQHDWNDWIGNRIAGSYHMFAGNDDNSRNEREFSYKASILEASLRFNFYFLKGTWRRTDYKLYAFAGISGLFYTTYWKYVDPADPNKTILPGRAYADTWIDKDMYMRNPTRFYNEYYDKKEDMFKYSSPSLAIPFGFGLSFPITQEIELAGELAFNYMVGGKSDFLDGYYTKWSNMNDAYVTGMVSIQYRINGSSDCYAKYGKRQLRK
ncbi:MAG: hypothetical protein LBR81_07415 [Prevotellaceae bacterium]|jgi:hypothetical protein|nr:hypothetical protein [Prevotellaceae bacterium]